MAPEAVRERDLNRYYQPYKNALSHFSRPAASRTASDDSQSSQWTRTYDGYAPQHSPDRALTAFAQLSTLRLGVRRSIISLVDSTRQYILTEATRTLSLSRHTIDKEDDRLWLGNAVLNRGEGLCDSIFGSTYTATDEDGSSYTSDAFVVCDMTKDPVLCKKPFVTGQPGVRFYAGVPMRTRGGHIIGVYACSHNQPRDGITIAEFKFLEDMAETVMEHLEMIRDREDRSRGERMVRGLAEFIEGSCSLGMEPTEKGTALSPIVNGIATAGPSKVLEKQTQNIRSMESGEHVPETLSGPKASKRIKEPEPSNPNCLFYRAANLIRKSTFADGVVWFQSAGVASRSKVPQKLSSEETSMDDSFSATSGSDNLQGSPTLKQGRFSRNTKLTPQKPKTPKAGDATYCEVIGLSISENAPGDILTTKDFCFSERSMEKYVTKFPYGKFFSFTETGSGVSSGDDKSEVEPVENIAVGIQRQNEPPPKPGKSKRQKFIPIELLKVLPAVRTLIFLPLWDAAAERWIAGGFIWTSKSNYLTSPHNELPYLKAFGNSITSEYARMNALIADRAKSDFISSISHELRSPLHGILGSVEFLNETDITNYQAGLTASIETCSKTLLETLEHILDYAKINKLYNRDRSSRKLEARSRKKENDNSIMGPMADVDVNQIFEEVSESVCAGHAFRETHAAPGQLEAPKPQTSCNLAHLPISLEITPRLNNLVRTQPGAIRRIVMNILGNALKYTDEGYVAVNMMATPSKEPDKVDINLTVRDTGRGMSKEFQKTRLWSPFSQEDPFSDGTGLGLSIVRQIVDSLDGNIEIRSKKSMGTTVEVFLTLPTVNASAEVYSDVRTLSVGKRIYVLRQQSCGKNLEPCSHALIMNSKEWFDIDVSLANAEDLTEGMADAVIIAEDFPQFDRLTFASSTPIIVVCKNQANQVALRKRLLGTLPECPHQNLQILAQPLGPMKLAAAYKYIFSRPGPRRSERSILSPAADLEPVTLETPQPPSDSPLEGAAAVADATANPNGTAAMEAKPLPQPAAATNGNGTAGGDGSDAPQPGPKPGPKPARLNSGLSQEPGSYHHVLLVDDNAINLKLLTMFMKKISLPYLSACDGLEALEAYKAHAPPHARNGSTADNASIDAVVLSPPVLTMPPPFTYVLMDLSMPVMDGLESTRRIRAFERHMGLRRAVIVALTGLASAEAQADALSAGVDFYLAKPVRFADLKKLMDV